MPSDRTVEILEVMDGSRDATRADHVVEVPIHIVMDHALAKIRVEILRHGGELLGALQPGKGRLHVV